MMYSLKIHHPFIVNASSVWPKRMMCFLYLFNQLHTTFDSLFVHWYQVVVTLGECLLQAFDNILQCHDGCYFQ